MGKATHTPGPWEALADDEGAIVMTRATLADDADEFPVALCRSRDHKVADSNLIAAAPELLAALKSLTNEMSYHNPGGTTKPQQAALRLARAALAKASGDHAEGRE